MKTPNKSRVCYYLPQKLIQKIIKKAKREGVSRSEIIARLVESMK